MNKLFFGVAFALLATSPLAYSSADRSSVRTASATVVLVQDDQDQDQDIPRSDEEGDDESDDSGDECP